MSVFFHLAKNAFTELSKNDPLRMAGATAFFTTFALPPILVILIQVLGLVFDQQRIARQLIEKLSGIIGPESVRQVVSTLRGFRNLAQNSFITIGGFIFLLFVATTLFKIIKSSMNQVWKIKAIKKRKLLGVLSSRWHSILVILVAGLLFNLGLFIEGMQTYLGEYINELSPLLALYFNGIFNHVFSVIIVTAWFSILFRYLPDARLPWKIILVGAFVTSLLFNIGKIILHWLLTYNNINTLYGASASVVLLLLFVFYSSLILFYGTAFTKIWAAHCGHPVKPLPYAMTYHLAETTVDDEQ